MGKTRILTTLLAGLLSGSALASFDEDGCGFWLAGCDLDLPAYPFLAVDNDTRANLILLDSDRRGLASSFPPSATDQRRSRAQPFTITRVMPPTGSDDMGQVIIAVDSNTLQKLAAQLGVDISALTFTNGVVRTSGGPAVSNNPATLTQFFQVLADDDQLTPAQRTALADERLRLLMGDGAAPVTEPFAPGSHAADLSNYLRAAAAFYHAQYSDAESVFLSLLDAGQPWVAETAHYMLLRLALNQTIAQAQDEYGMLALEKSDRAAAELAIQRADRYLEHYPDGRYAQSTRGLYRRIYWMIGDWDRLAVNTEQALSRVTSVEELQALVNEVDGRLLSRHVYAAPAEMFISADDTPLLTLTQTLRRLRTSYTARPAAVPVTAEEINGYRAQFTKAGMPAAAQYLQAAWLLYQQNDAAGAAAAIAPHGDKTLTDTLDFSLQILRGLALQQQKKWSEAEEHWRHLLTLKTTATQQQFLQLMLANALAYQGQPEKIFAADSPVINLRFRSLVLKTLADRPLLRQQVVAGASDEERTIALYTLLTRDLQHGDFAGYLQDRPLGKALPPQTKEGGLGDSNLSRFNWDGSNVEPGYFCASLDKTAEALAQRPQDGHALNCMGEFFRLTETRVDSSPEYSQQWRLAQAPDGFQGEKHSRLAYYQQVIANPKAEPEDQSYALYRAIMCYAPSGYNSCDEQEIEPGERRAWFRQLKTEYQGSEWARKLTYYW